MSIDSKQNFESDEEFRFLVQPYTLSDISAKEKNIRENGCLDPIQVWNNVIVEGYDRYKICAEIGIPCSVVFRNYGSREEAYEFICRTQLQRKDLTMEMKKYLIGRSFQASYAIRKNEYHKSLQNEYCYLEVAPVRKTKVATDVARELQVSVSTVVKYDQYAGFIENVRKKVPEFAVSVLRGEIKVSHENLEELIRLPKEDMQGLYKNIKTSGLQHISNQEIRRALRWQTRPSRNTAPKTEIIIPEIRKMPEYDPNAETSALALTIPSWVGSLDRYEKCAQFMNATPKAINELQEKLMELSLKAEHLVSITEKKEVNSDE